MAGGKVSGALGTGKNRKMVCSLTNGDSNNAKTLSLTASRHYIQWLYKQTDFTHSAKLSAGRVTQILCSLAQDYNCKIMKENENREL
jgi:hypothetical protein